MKIHILSIALLIAALSMSVQPAAATSIDTTGSYLSDIAAIGSSYSGTYGQTFTVSGPDTQLDSFSFYLRDIPHLGSGTLDFRGYIASWDSGNFRASSILFESATQTMTSADTLKEFDFSPGGLDLATAQQYVAFLSISNLPLQAANSGFAMPLASGSALSGGEFVFLNNPTDFSALTSSTWFSYTPADAWFKASLSAPRAVPEPSSLLLLGAGLLCLVAWRRKHVA